jgi:hypothetical protein
MTLELSSREARILWTHLGLHVAWVEKELAHTDKHELQVALGKELDQLRDIQARLDRLMAVEEQPSAV